MTGDRDELSKQRERSGLNPGTFCLVHRIDWGPSSSRQVARRE